MWRKLKNQEQSDGKKVDKANSPQLLEPLPDVCNGCAPYLLVMIPTAPSQRLFRDVNRYTWGRVGRVQRQRRSYRMFKSSINVRPVKKEIQVLFLINSALSFTGRRKTSLAEEQALEKDLLLAGMLSGFAGSRLKSSWIAAIVVNRVDPTGSDEGIQAEIHQIHSDCPRHCLFQHHMLPIIRSKGKINTCL
ncbi:beta-1,3-galactosyltransferase 4 [Elysia marginata]|uniref:Beta-1,3-galactosyltransferase 4 n=1 Tax=Elysia marginata TaxID=1093978 RepID=A0AAV4H6F7_9GAST|nr:beta-1,3-galactosyltransferase 4 [Elysia marginata]